MSAFDQIMNIFNKTAVDVRILPNNELQLWSHARYCEHRDGTRTDEPGEWNASVFFDSSGAISGLTTYLSHGHITTAVGQLADSLRLLSYVLDCEGGWNDLNELKLRYRKVGEIVEVDIISCTMNWWNYEKDGLKVQSIFSTEFHEGPDIEEVEATLVYDPATNKLQAR